MILAITVLAILVFLSAFFSGMETAIMSLDTIKVEYFLENKKPGSKYLKKLYEDIHRTVIAILIGNNLVNISSAVLATLIFTQLFDNAGAGIATGVMTFLTLVFGEITPKSYCLTNNEKISLKLGFIIYYLKIIIKPLVWFFNLITILVKKITNSKENALFTEAEFRTMINLGKKNQVLEQYESKLIEEVLEFNDLKVAEVLVPREKVFMFEANTKILVALDEIANSGFSRIPVYDESENFPVGFVHVHDILRLFGSKMYNATMRDIITEPLKITQDEIIDDVFHKMSKEKKHMAFCYNGKNEFIGIVTLEDLLEEIFGEIEDESDKKVKESKIKSFKKNDSIIIPLKKH